jgi:F-type H+-transporting ATPase subunit a
MDFQNILSPLDQFEIRDLISINAPILFNTHISLTSFGLYVTLASIVAIYLNILSYNKKIVFSN